MDWLILAILQFAFMAICYVTNPIVVLFADERGELPRLLRWWQTYDNCLDIDWMIYEDIVPKWMQYDFNKHYKYYLEDKGDGYMRAGYVDLLDGNFTIKERIQRYFCRLMWLYRNTGYGFAYEVCGKDFLLQPSDAWTNYSNGKGDKCFAANTGNVWCFYLEKTYYKNIYLRIYLGWKLKGTQKYKNVNRAMLALHVNPFRSI